VKEKMAEKFRDNDLNPFSDWSSVELLTGAFACLDCDG
jgi:hypothetical protein